MTAATALAPKLSAMRTIGAYCELVKPRIMAMALLTAAGALGLAPGRTPSGVTVWLLLGTAAIVGAANTLNMYIERDIDCMMTRTRNRPLPTKRLRKEWVLAFGMVLATVSLPMLAQVNLLTAGLGLVALVSYVGVYTPMKQRTHWAAWVGALPGALPVLMGWAAATHAITLGGLAVFSILFVWQIPHFHAIAMYRRREYERAGLKTLPGTRGEPQAVREIQGYLVVQVALSLSLAPLGVAGWVYTSTAALLGAVVLVQAWLMGPRRSSTMHAGVGATPGASVADATPALNKWARNVFIVSIIYLPILFIVMVIDGQV